MDIYAGTDGLYKIRFNMLWRARAPVGRMIVFCSVFIIADTGVVVVIIALVAVIFVVVVVVAGVVKQTHPPGNHTVFLYTPETNKPPSSNEQAQ